MPINVKLNRLSLQKKAVSLDPLSRIRPPSGSMNAKVRLGGLSSAGSSPARRLTGLGAFSKDSIMVSIAASGKSFFRNPLFQICAVPGQAKLASAAVNEGSVVSPRDWLSESGAPKSRRTFDKY